MFASADPTDPSVQALARLPFYGLMPKNEAQRAVENQFFAEADKMGRPQMAEKQTQAGIKSLNDMDWDGAILAFNRAWSLIPNNPEIHKKLAEAVARRDQDCATTQYILMTGKIPTTDPVWAKLTAYFSDPKCLNQPLPNSYVIPAPAWLVKRQAVDAYMDARKAEVVQPHFDRAVALNPEDVQLWMLYGTFLIRKADGLGSARAYKHAADLDAKHPQALILSAYASIFARDFMTGCPLMVQAQKAGQKLSSPALEKDSIRQCNEWKACGSPTEKAALDQCLKPRR